ncbi:MmcQ/YjbR family DNA-binding protein [Streptomyces sp. CA2R106]|uniref:MmcQ/YjbR family DNA-binding protein n=1 Tax=Streptomyces sp. CA2R106 TaxID=3120153 RepID=UPI003FA734B1
MASRARGGGDGGADEGERSADSAPYPKVTPEQVAELALDLPETAEENPFGPGVDVYKVAGRIFAILSPDTDPPSVSLKCDPALSLHLRDRYPAVTPGYHLNKKHWNTVALDGTIPPDELDDLVAHSYSCVVAGLPKATRDRLLLLTPPVAPPAP